MSLLPRRGLLLRAFLGLQALAAALLAFPAIRYLLTPLSSRGSGQDWVRLCLSAEVAEGASPVGLKYRRVSHDAYRDTVETGLLWVSRRDGHVLALSSVCTHLGCAVNWDEKRKALLCPCHGGIFSAQGQVQAGPPPRPLARFSVKEEAGAIWVRPNNSGTPA